MAGLTDSSPTICGASVITRAEAAHPAYPHSPSPSPLPPPSPQVPPAKGENAAELLAAFEAALRGYECVGEST